MTKLFKLPTNEAIVHELENRFDHPAITLFRGRELAVVRDYFAKHQLPLASRVLDLGCGEGNIGSILLNRISVGIDVLKADLKKAKKNKVYQKLELADARKMPFKNGAFDLVFSNSVIEHINGIDDVVREVSRVLKPGGLFIFTAPTSYFGDHLYFAELLRRFRLGWLGALYIRARNQKLDHFNLLDHQSWRRKLAGDSLQILYYQYYLSPSDMREWDKICVALRLTSGIRPLNQILKNIFVEKVRQMLNITTKINRGASMLVVAKKHDK